MNIQSLTLSPARALPLRRVVAVMAGALLVAVGAQIAVPLPGTPVPITFQIPAVVIVGGLLGPRLGATSMVLYLLAGLAGLPVFAPVGAPGLARLIGPTGGYLLAFPVAAAVTGFLVRKGASAAMVAAGVLAGFAVVHAGGLTQLLALTGDVRGALVIGTIPFVVGDGIKLVLAGWIVWRFAPALRARL